MAIVTWLSSHTWGVPARLMPGIGSMLLGVSDDTLVGVEEIPNFDDDESPARLIVSILSGQDGSPIRISSFDAEAGLSVPLWDDQWGHPAGVVR